MENKIYHIIKKKDLLFPYKTEFSLHKVIENWEQKAKSQDLFTKKKAAILLELLELQPELKSPISSLKDFKGDLSILQHLFSDVYAVDFRENEALSITSPFIFKHIFQTEKFEYIMQNIDPDDEKFKTYLEQRILLSRLIHAYNFIFEKLYGLELQETDIPLVIPCKNPENGLVRYYTEELYTQFIDIRVKDLEPLKAGQIDELVSNYANTPLWLKYLPSEKIHFCGVGLLKLNDITERESLTRLQDVLLENSLLTANILERLESILRNFLELPNIKVGIIAYDDYLDLYKIDHNIWSSVLIKSGVNFSYKKLKRLFSHRLRSTGDIIHIQTNEPSFLSTKIRIEIEKAGTHSLMLAPLFRQGKLFGILEISSSKQMNMSFSANKLSNVLPLFERAIERSLETVHNRIQTIIKENCTAIHPSVEWKFRKLAFKAYQTATFGEEIPEMKDIIFKKVYPLYGNIDIRNSTIQRNRAIFEDLETQLRLALEAVNGLLNGIRIRILEQLKYSLEERLEEHLEFPGVQDGEDVYEFFETEVNPVFNQLRKDKRIDQNWVKHYLNRLDPELEILYEQRKAFESSVSKINSTIGSFLDRDQTHAQNIYPHYFEKFKTDGVDYSIFIGPSISPKIAFTNVYLRNLRLWQFENMVNTAHHLLVHKLELDMPLDTAQLIFVQNVPIDIKFRYDEKRFDVDGTFHSRFEIVKKRLDKAMISGNKERLTQPGKIAIVYSQNLVLGEYLDYIDYLQHKKLLSSEVEFLEIDHLQGAEGLKAIRVSLIPDKSLADATRKKLKGAIK